MKGGEKIRLRILICSLLMFSVFLLNHSFSYAYNGGLIEGVVGSGTTQVNVEKITDNDLSTSKAFGNGTAVTYTFPTVKSVESYFAKSTGTTAHIQMFDASGNVLWSDSGVFVIGDTGGTKKNFPYIVDGVKSIKYYWTGSASHTLYELDFYEFKDVIPPVKPVGLTVTSGDKKVVLNWTANSESDLKLYRIFKNGVDIGTSSTNSYTVSMLDDESASFQIQAVDQSNNGSVLSNSVVGRAWIAPAEKPVITAEEKEFSLVLSWESARAVQYYLFYVNGQLVKATTDKTYEVVGLDTNKAYSFYVVAVDQYARSTYSDVYTFTTKAPPPPVYPVITVLTKSTDTFSINWTNSGMFYDVYLDGVKLKTQNESSYFFSGLIFSKSYDVKIVAHDIYQRLNETTLTVMTNDPPPVKSPVLKLAGKNWEKIDLSWDDTGTTYKVFMDDVEVSSTTKLNYTQYVLQPSTTYKFKLTTVDIYGRDLESNVLSVKTDSIPGEVKLSLKAVSVTSNSARLLWDDRGASGYEVSSSGTKIGDSKTIFYQLSNLNEDTSYTYDVSYVDSYNRTVVTSVTFKTLKAAPPSPTPTPGQPSPIPPAVCVQGSNSDLNSSCDKLVESVGDMKEGGLNLIAVIIGVVILVFFALWIWKIIKRNMSKANSSKSGSKGRSSGSASTDNKKGQKAVTAASQPRKTNSNFTTFSNNNTKFKYRKRYIPYEKTNFKSRKRT